MHLKVIFSHVITEFLSIVFIGMFNYSYLLYNVAVFQWITSCNKSVMTSCVLTLLREYVTSLMTSITTMLIFIGNMSTLKVIKLYLRSRDKTNHTLMVISYEIY